MLEFLIEYQRKFVGEFIFDEFDEKDYQFIMTKENGRLIPDRFEPSPGEAIFHLFPRGKDGKPDLNSQNGSFRIKVFERNQEIRTLGDCWVNFTKAKKFCIDYYLIIWKYN